MLPTSNFLNFINQQGLFSPVDKILLAVSGGMDSVLLTHLFNAARYNFGIAHCNFGLRGDEADADEFFCEQLAEQFNIPFYKIKFNTTAYASLNKISIQMAARELRYSWFEEIRSKNDYQYIALAHHASDTTETILLNLTRGTGIAGLHGILPKRGKLVRPLLFLKRDEILEIVKEENITYRDDSSNFSTKYARNKIRLDVIPKLKELNPKLDETFEANSRRFTQIEDFLNTQISKIREVVFKQLANGKIEISLDELRALQPLQLALFELFKDFNFSEQVLGDLIRSWNGQPGKIFESATHLILLDRGKLILEKKERSFIKELVLNQDDKTAGFNNVLILIQTTDAENWQVLKDQSKASFDASLLQFPLKLRLWKTGDYFYPFGMKGKKKLSDYFSGMKIPLTEKNNIPLLENGNGDILWIVGYRSDNRYKVTPLTKKVITFEKLY